MWDGKDLSEGNKRLFRADGFALAEDEPAATVLHLALLTGCPLEALALLLAACPELATTADAHGRLSLLVLGPEVGSELSGRSKWAELLDGHGLGATELCVCFCGPRVPTSLDGAERRVLIPSGVLRFAFLRGVWHDPRVQARVPLVHSAPQLALAFNSGLADYAAGWLPTMRALFWQRGIPLACTSYHAPEAELDARTLAVSMRVPLQ
jgi:hypothetical protein